MADGARSARYICHLLIGMAEGATFARYIVLEKDVPRRGELGEIPKQ
jgi:hypothetical protein